jgi:hypothetical protein
MMALRKQPKTVAVLAIALVIGAFVVASWLWSETKQSGKIDGDSVGICVHSLSANDARLVKESGAQWIRIDVSSDFGVAVTNAKAYNLKVLGILDSWMFDKSSTFTLEDWRGNVTYYVSQYADYVDAWEIWNEPANPTYPLLNLELNNSKPNYQENMGKIVNFYYSMAQTAYPIIRQYDQNATIVLFGGLNLYSGGDQHLSLDMDFASQLDAKGIEQYGNAISVHAYPWGPVQPQVWESYTKSIADYTAKFHLDVWVTETGQPLQDSASVKIDEVAQAQYMVDGLGYFNGAVTKVFWYSLKDNVWEQKQETPQSFGLIGDDNVPRDAYAKLQTCLGK